MTDTQTVMITCKAAKLPALPSQRSLLSWQAPTVAYGVWVDSVLHP